MQAKLNKLIDTKNSIETKLLRYPARHAKFIHIKEQLINIDNRIFLTQKCIQMQKQIKEKRADGDIQDAETMSDYLLCMEMRICDLCPHDKTKLLPPASPGQEPDKKCLDCGGILQ